MVVWNWMTIRLAGAQKFCSGSHRPAVQRHNVTVDPFWWASNVKVVPLHGTPDVVGLPPSQWTLVIIIESRRLVVGRGGEMVQRGHTHPRIGRDHRQFPPCKIATNRGGFTSVSADAPTVKQGRRADDKFLSVWAHSATRQPTPRSLTFPSCNH